VGRLVGIDEGCLVTPGVVGQDVVGYLVGPVEGRLVGTLVVGRDVGADDGTLDG